MDAPQIYLTLVVPAFNEASRIAAPLETMARYLDQCDYRAEIVVVDDGSTDGTAQLIRERASSLPVPARLIRYEQNRGKGFALKVGFAHARGERIVFSDADLATPIEEVASLMEQLDAGFDAAIGSRKTSGAEIQVHQPRFREFLGKGFTKLVRIVIAEVSDATCGLKAYRGEVGRDVFSRLRVDRWAFDAEALFLLRRRGSRVAEVPVVWRDQPDTKVDLLRDVVGSLLALVWIRLLAAFGAYRHPREPDVDVECWELSQSM